MLKLGGYAESPAPGVWRLTAKGRDILASHPGQFDDAMARAIAREARHAIRADVDDIADPLSEQSGVALQQTPEERIETAVKEVEAAVARELLERISHVL